MTRLGLRGAALGLIALAALGASAAAPAGPSVLYAPRTDALVFSHARHQQRAIGCAVCHPAAATSRSSVDLLAPTEAQCRACHAIDRAAPSSATCGKCHRAFRVGGEVARVQATPAALKFSHAAHDPLACQRCHLSAAAPPTTPTAANQATTPTAANQAMTPTVANQATTPTGTLAVNDAPGLPTMASCLGCHRDGAAATRCTICHLAGPSGRIDTSLGTALDLAGGGPRRAALRPSSDRFGDAHRPGFAADHRAAATRADRTCAACHDESYCADCHAGTIRPMAFHPDDYLQVHAIAAKRAASECSTCHRYQTFCVGCHERVGVGTRAASEWSGGQGPAPFHPAGWASTSGGGNLHAREARRNLPTCASCHREDDCLRCHSADADGLRVTPHPPGWRGSDPCRALDRGNRRMCLRCHVTADELGCDWTAAR